MKTNRTKYLSYIEETQKYHSLLGEVAKISSIKAIAKSKRHSVDITILEGEDIVKLDAKGNREIIGKIENNRKRVKVGETAKFKK